VRRAVGPPGWWLRDGVGAAGRRPGRWRSPRWSPAGRRCRSVAAQQYAAVVRAL